MGVCYRQYDLRQRKEASWVVKPYTSSRNSNFIKRVHNLKIKTWVSKSYLCYLYIKIIGFKMSVKRFSMVFSEEEWREYNNFKKSVNIKTLSSLFRQSLQIIMNEPSLLNITRPTTDYQESLDSLWESIEFGRQQKEHEQQELNQRLEIMLNNINLIAAKLKIPKSEREKASNIDTTGRAIF